MPMTEKDLQQLLTETKMLACMNKELRLKILNSQHININEEDLCVLLENNTNFLKYFYDCLIEAIEKGNIRW